MQGINPKVLIWAREQAGFSQEEIAAHLKKDLRILQEWEKGFSGPSFPQLEKLAKKYKRPTALFFFSEIPEEKSIKDSFRTLPEKKIIFIQPHLRFLIRKAKAMRINLLELNNDHNPAENFLLDDLTVGKRSIDTVAAELRNYLGVDLETQRQFKKHDTAFKKWRHALEKHGIFVFKDAFKDDGFSGFCLYDKIFPIIWVNNSMSHSRQIFTLFHELAHLLFNRSDIEMSSSDENYLDNLSSEDKKIEIFCNAFAGKFLVPDDAFSKHLGREVDDYNLNNIAKRFVVSREVILRKFLDNNKITSAFYSRKVSQWRDEYEAQEKRKTGRSGGNTNYTKRVYLGENYMEMVFSQYYQNNISTEQLADYLGVKVSRIPKMESLIFEERTKQ